MGSAAPRAVVGSPADTPIVTPWDARIARARELAPQSAPAREILTFYTALAEYQRDLFVSAIEEGTGARDGSFIDGFPFQRAAAAAPDCLHWLATSAPAPTTLKTAAGGHLRDVSWTVRLREGLASALVSGGASPFLVDEPEPFVVRSLLQPFAEAMATPRRDNKGTVARSVEATPERCPICGDGPRVGVLREAGHGAKKTLQCGRCFTEWEFPRLRCPSCGETRFNALQVFTADALPHVRVEACETCHGYLKTIDLTVDGLAVPLVDDLASVPLDLWAAERGYGATPIHARP